MCLGDSLVYEHGVGVQKQGEGKEIKENMISKKRVRRVKRNCKKLSKPMARKALTQGFLRS